MRLLILLVLTNIAYGLSPLPFAYRNRNAIPGLNYVCPTDSNGVNLAGCPWFIPPAVLAAESQTANKTTFTFKTNWWSKVPTCTTNAFAITSTTITNLVVGNQTTYSCGGGVSGCGCEDYDWDGCYDYCACSGGPEGDDWCCGLTGKEPDPKGIYVPTTGPFTLTCHI